MKGFVRKNTRLLYLVAALLLIGLYFTPIWKIRLEAPQYPEGITMYIWLNKINGNDPNTLNSINILNHYIGMQRITPQSIPELKYFPFVNLFLVVSGIIVFFINKKSLRLSWLVLLLILSGLGIYDFYLWEYNYGHNLDPHAPIKIPGMVYQPPLIGVKWLLNFKAFSFPYYGGILMGISILLGAIVSCAEFNLFKRKIKHATPVIMMALLTTLTACNIKPEPINYGQDSCHLCSMVIMDKRYGTEAVTEKGRIQKFDSIECLIRYLLQQKDENNWHKFILITDFNNPGTLVDASGGAYLISENLPSPMGAFLTGFASGEDAEVFHEQHGGTLYNWGELLNHFNER